jgi:hypothetical protein
MDPDPGSRPPFGVLPLTLADGGAVGSRIFFEVVSRGKLVGELHPPVDALSQGISRRYGFAQAVSAHANAPAEQQDQPIPVQNLRPGEQQDHRSGHQNPDAQCAHVQRELTELTAASAVEKLPEGGGDVQVFAF